jgi:hypothetical protein
MPVPPKAVTRPFFTHSETGMRRGLIFVTKPSVNMLSAKGQDSRVLMNYPQLMAINGNFGSHGVTSLM